MPSIKNRFLDFLLSPTETPHVLKKQKNSAKASEYIKLVQKYRNKVCACVKFM